MTPTGNVLNLLCPKNVDSVSINYLNNTLTASVLSQGLISSIKNKHIQCDWAEQKDLSLSKVKELVGSSTITIEQLKPGKFSLKIAMVKQLTTEEYLKRLADLRLNCLQKSVECIEKEFGNFLSGYEICIKCVQFESLSLPANFDDMLTQLLSSNNRSLVVHQDDPLESLSFVINFLKNYQSNYLPFYAKWMANKQNELLSINYVLKSLDFKGDISFLKSIPTLWFIQIEVPTRDEDRIKPEFCKKDFTDWPLAKLVVLINGRHLGSGDAQRFFAPKGQTVLSMSRDDISFDTCQLKEILESKGFLQEFTVDEGMEMLNTIGIPLRTFFEYYEAVDALPVLAKYRNLKPEMSLMDRWVFSMSLKLNDRCEKNIANFRNHLAYLYHLINLTTLQGKTQDEILFLIESEKVDKYRKTYEDIFKTITQEANKEFNEVLGIEYNSVYHFKFPYLEYYIKHKQSGAWI